MKDTISSGAHDLIRVVALVIPLLAGGCPAHAHDATFSLDKPLVSPGHRQAGPWTAESSVPAPRGPAPVADLGAAGRTGALAMENREDGADERRDPIAESGGSQSGPVSLLGSHLEEAQKTDFFNFFNLREDTVVLRPGGDFRDLAAVNVHLDRQGRISDMELRLSRSFIDDRKSAVFAGDFAKSFLRSAVPPADREAVEALAMDIEYRHPRETGFEIMPLHPGAVPPLPEQPSPGYPVYVGKQPLYEQALSRSALRLENLQVEGIDVLLISLRIEGDWALDGDEERPAEMQDEYQDTGLFAPAAAQELLRQAHWTAQFDSAGQFTSSLRPRLCFLLLQALESPENEVYPLQDGAATDPGRTEPGVAGGAFPPGGRRTPTAHPTAHGRGVPGTVDGG